MKRPALPALLALAVTAAACENVVVRDAGHGDDDVDAEAAYDADDIAAAFVVDGDLAVSPVVAAHAGANRVALMGELSRVDPLRAVARGVDGDGDDAVYGPWIDVEWTFAEAAAVDAAAAEDVGLVAGRAVLDGVYAGVQLAVPRAELAALSSVTFSAAFVDDGVSEFGDALTEPQLTAQALAPELQFVGVLPRSAWGARATRCSTRDGSFSRMALHHSAARSRADVFAMARQIQSYHVDGRGYCDAAYHFAVAQDGRVLELRPLPYRGGHTLNNNSGNIGVVFLGCFDPACGNEQPAGPLLESGAGLVAMLARLHGVAINGDRIRGHRDHAGAQTACPGANLHPRLGDIRARAAQILSGVNDAPPPPPGPPAASGCGIVGVNVVVGRGAAAVSCDGRVTFAHQGDGNVVVYDAARGGRAVWSTGTHGRATDALVMQGDGNLVLYAPGGRPIWASGTHGRPNTVLAVQDDGNVVLYAPGGRAIWSTGTHR